MSGAESIVASNKSLMKLEGVDSSFTVSELGCRDQSNAGVGQLELSLRFAVRVLYPTPKSSPYYRNSQKDP